MNGSDPQLMSLLCLLSRRFPSPDAAAAAQQIVTKGISWDAFFRVSVLQGTAPLIARNLDSLSAVPPEFAERFSGAYRRTLGENIGNIAEHDRIVKMLRTNEIEVISLKGPVFSERVLGDIGLYPSSDIDILVRPTDLDRVLALLRIVGYQLNDSGFEEYREFYMRELYHVSLSNGKFCIEPHWNLFFRYFAAPPEFWWEESRTFRCQGEEYRILSPERDILYNAFRFYTKNFSPLRFLVVVAELVRHHESELDWEKLFGYARQFRFETVLRTVLKMASELLGAPVPLPFAKVVGLRAGMLSSLAGGMTLRGAAASTVQKAVLTFLHDDLSGPFRILSKRLFPSMGEIVSRYKLPGISVKAVLYYIVNPFLLLTKRHHKNIRTPRSHAVK